MDTKEKRLKTSLEEGSITQEEYDKALKETQEKEGSIKKHLDKQEEEHKSKESKPLFSSDKLLLLLVVSLLVIPGLFFWFLFNSSDQASASTIEELHTLNLQGKLDSELGYVYKNVYSFVTKEDQWYTQLVSPSGQTLFNIAFRYSPRDLEDIRITGQFDDVLFNDADEYFVTFNPTGNDFSGVAVAVSDFNLHMTNAFAKLPIAACDRNETDVCIDRPIITCDNTDQIVLYVKESENFNVEYKDNCILVEGTGLDLVKGVDRVLYNFYNIMGK